MEKLNKTIETISPVQTDLTDTIQAHLDDLTKPRGSLGRLEEIAMQYCLVRNTSEPELPVKKIFCFAGDHGVAAEGVSAFPQEVTPQMVFNMLAGGAAINVFSRNAGADLAVVDIGVAAELSGDNLVSAKVKPGTDNIANGPAMSVEEAVAAVETGISLAQEAIENGYTLLGTGDMGIANTTPSTALYSAYLDIPVEDITGRGTGLNDEQLAHKTDIIKQALEVNKDRLTSPLDILAAIGGLEIAGICGLILGAAANNVPTVVDGFISTAGAVTSIMMKPEVRDYLFFSHVSQEKGHRAIVDHIKAKPILDLGLRLGEGTGGALAMSMIDASLKMYNEMATFSSAGVSEEE
ncbi:nicotinate-nucleotide--dimethylbenzimidazole phosphoribosyltransferase [bacterium E08(2017)]|nr:nicotinate-nucleotide--dimethylbenzimidazole phosphoribosyltransferase [bacterium E08(2017)]